MNFMKIFASRSCAVLVLMCIAAVAHADEIADIGKLLRGGQLDQAIQRVDSYLATKPRDAQGRFLKGLIQTEQNKTAEAITTFTRLTEDYPELPEPYNNLAVLYAGQGQYEKARQSLEMAIRTHPSYATAHENLGDVYAKLASQAYDKALQLDSNNPAAQSKLAMAKELIGSGNTRARAQASQATPAAQAAVKPLPGSPAPVVATAPAASTAPAVKPAAGAPAATPTGKPAAPKPVNEEAEVIASVNAWAAAWSKQDVKGYLSAYAKDFKVPGGKSRTSWEADRKQRVEAPKKIQVKIESPSVAVDGSSATIKFRQYYKSNIVTASSSKTLVMSKAGGSWQIVDEKSGN
jgi:tetratricopeptide (TPR) repeat protein